ncbi:Dehydrogenase reductase SDR member 13 [Coemansia sp. Benny D115]|nr:Dehydrogenase reductase SDR member 13 [Coemansia sp. Benny D115]
MGFSPVDAKPEWAPTNRQDGRRFIVTGANRGIGLATATGLAALGAQVTLVGHEGPEAFAAAIDQVALTTGCDRSALDYMALDLRSLASVRAFAAAWAQRPAEDQRLYGLINNAGIAGMPGVSPDGFEMCFQINYLSMFLLTRLLLPYLQPHTEGGSVDPARIVCVSSSAHLFTLGLPTDEQYLRQSGGGFFSLRYGESKLCVNSFVRQLSERLDPERVVACAVHPGSTASGFWSSFPAWAQRCIMSVTQDPSRGARTSLFCATERGLPSGAYFADCAQAAASFWLGSRAKADELWVKSCAWTGVSPNKALV